MAETEEPLPPTPEFYTVPNETGTISFITSPDYKWRWSFKDVPEFQVSTLKAPNWFNRLMQKWILGIVWEKL